MSDKEYDVIDEILEEAAENAAEDIAGEDIPEVEPTDFSAEEKPEEAGDGEIPVEGPEEEKPQPEKPAADAIGPDAKPEDKPEKRGLFRKKPDKRDEQIAELTDKLKRQLAEFENFRNRTDREKAAMYEIGARGVIEKLLPVLDNFERGLAAAPEEKDSFMTGMEMVYTQLVKALTDLGVEEIAAKDAPFDPAFHNAVMHVDDENFGENVVCEVFQKGYTYHGIVIRPAMVKVAN